MSLSAGVGRFSLLSFLAMSSCSSKTEHKPAISTPVEAVSDWNIPETDKAAMRTTQTPQALVAKATLLELQKMESIDPKSAKIKLEIGNRYWCLNNKAFAVENWNWVSRFGWGEPIEQSLAKDLLNLIREKKESAISAKICNKASAR